MKLPKHLLSYTEKNLSKALIILIFALLSNIVSAVICVISDSYLYLSAFFAITFIAAAISNVIGAKNGETFNVHIFRRMWLRDHDRESEYEEICLKCLTVMVPISVVWSVVNFGFAVTSIIMCNF